MVYSLWLLKVELLFTVLYVQTGRTKNYKP